MYTLFDNNCTRLGTIWGNMLSHVYPSWLRALGLPRWLSGKESTCQCRRHRRLWFDPLGRTPGGGNDNLLQYICLGNHMDRGAWLAMTVYGVAKNWTQLSTHARNSQRSLVITLTLRLRNLSTFLRSTPVIIMWFVLTLRIDLIKKTDTYTTYCNIKYTKISIV